MTRQCTRHTLALVLFFARGSCLFATVSPRRKLVLTIRETSGKKDKKENTKHIIIIAELEGGEDCGDEGGTYVRRKNKP